MKKLIVLLALLLASPAFAQYAHRSAPGTAEAAPLTITAAGAGNGWCISTEGTDSMFVSLTGTWVGTVNFVGTNDRLVTTKALPLNQISAVTGVLTAAVTTTAANGDFIGSSNGMRQACVYFSAYTSGTLSVRLDADPSSTFESVQGVVGGVPIKTSAGSTTTATTPTSGSLTAATSTTVYAGAAGICQVAVSNLSATIAMTCGQGTTSLTQGLYVAALQTYTTSWGYGGQVQCFPASGTPAYSVQITVCP